MERDGKMKGRRKGKRLLGRNELPLKTLYYRLFLFFIVIPLLIVLAVSLMVLNQQFKKQAIENITQAQETIITELESDIDVMSMRLSHMVYTNNSEIMDYAAGTDAAGAGERYHYQQQLAQAGNLVLEPVRNIVSAGFYLKSGKEIYIKNEIKRPSEEIRDTGWYQAALAHPNTVCVGSYDTAALNDLFKGGKKDMLILVFALAPDVTIDRSQRVEMVAFYQSTDAADRIRKYNTDYAAGENKLGMTRITNQDGALVFSTAEAEGKQDFPQSEYTCVRTPLAFNDTVWYIESYIRHSELTADYRETAVLVLGAAVLVLLFAGFFSSYFVYSIVNPIEEISGGLHQVEEGNLEVHIAPRGQFEVRTMIHSFNAMVRRLKALIEEYEEKVRHVEKRPADYLAAMLEGSMSPEEVSRASQEFFMEPYAILYFLMEGYPNKEKEAEDAGRLAAGFEHNPRFASRCILYRESSRSFYIVYRITEEDYIPAVTGMVRQLQGGAVKEYGIHITACIGARCFGAADFMEQAGEVKKKICLRYLEGADAVIHLSEDAERKEWLLRLSENYEKLAAALYIADEKNMTQEREHLFETISSQETDAAKAHAYAAILAIGSRFSTDNSDFSEIFGVQYNYLEKIGRIEETRGLKLWLTNYFAWIMDYSASKLRVSETDVIVRAKRYIADYYEDADLSLARVAEYAGLNEKYFTNRFTKETGETFSAYVTGLRVQKAEELLKTTTFKVYEIAEMVGYRNVEHFNRVFKKVKQMSPQQYRKTM